MEPRTKWVLLAYRLPREPSTPRITLWRQLRRLGVAQVADGVVALPLDARTHEQLEWLADQVTDAGGDASVWLASLASRAQERALAQRMADAVAAEYRALLEEVAATARTGEGPRRQVVGRLRRELRRIRARDYFPEPIAREAQAAVDGLVAPAAEAAS
jgi:DNA-binding transcriptional regulator PaaX